MDSLLSAEQSPPNLVLRTFFLFKVIQLLSFVFPTIKLTFYSIDNKTDDLIYVTCFFQLYKYVELLFHFILNAHTLSLFYLSVGLIYVNLRFYCKLFIVTDDFLVL